MQPRIRLLDLNGSFTRFTCNSLPASSRFGDSPPEAAVSCEPSSTCAAFFSPPFLWQLALASESWPRIATHSSVYQFMLMASQPVSRQRFLRSSSITRSFALQGGRLSMLRSLLRHKLTADFKDFKRLDGITAFRMSRSSHICADTQQTR